MTVVDFPRKEKIVALGQVITDLLIVRDGNVTLTHPRGNVPLASLGRGEMINAEAFLRRISSTRKYAPVTETTSRWIVTASTAVRCYVISLDEIARNCSGGHGQKTHKLLQNWLEVQDTQRRTHFKRLRRWQAKIIAERISKSKTRETISQLVVRPAAAPMKVVVVTPMINDSVVPPPNKQLHGNTSGSGAGSARSASVAARSPPSPRSSLPALLLRPATTEGLLRQLLTSPATPTSSAFSLAALADWTEKTLPIALPLSNIEQAQDETLRRAVRLVQDVVANKKKLDAHRRVQPQGSIRPSTGSYAPSSRQPKSSRRPNTALYADRKSSALGIIRRIHLENHQGTRISEFDMCSSPPAHSPHVPFPILDNKPIQKHGRK